MAQRILAVELGQDWVQAALAERTWSSLTLIGTFAAHRQESEEDIRGALERLLAQVGDVDITVSAIAGELIAKRLLMLPFGNRRQLEQAVPFALEEHLPFTADEGVVGFVPLARRGTSSLVMACFVRRNDLRRHLDMLGAVGLDPKLVTVSALALPALLEEPNGGATGARLLLDVSRWRAAMVLLDGDGVARAFRVAPTRSSDANGAAQQRVLDPVVLRSLRQILSDHVLGSETVELIMLGAENGELSAQLESEFSLPVRSTGAFINAERLAGATPRDMEFAGCLAMLLSQHPQISFDFLNFRRDEFVFLGRGFELGPWRTPLVLLCALALFGALDISLDLAARYRRLDLLNAQISAVAAPVLGPIPASQVMPSLRSAIAQSRKRLWTLGGKGSRASSLDVLLAISRALKPTMGIELDELTLDESGVKLTGTAASYASVSLIKEALAKQNELTNIAVTEAKASGQSGKVDFRASAALNAANTKTK
jgi:type II secretion system protein L